MQPIRADCRAMTFLKGYVETIRNMASEMEVTVGHAAVLHICDLIALSVGAEPDAAELMQERGLRAARYDAICKLILANLGNPSLSVTDIARVQRVTPRYVQLLFERTGTTFSAFLLARRLALVHRCLSNPLFCHRSIGSLALDAGFGDLSYFNRVFRRAYGETPSDVRYRALRADPQGRSRPIR